jgi:hypothetical protein
VSAAARSTDREPAHKERKNNAVRIVTHRAVTQQLHLALGAVLAGVTATAASARVPEGMTKAEYRALHIRSEALNNLYGTAVTRLSPAQFAASWNAGASRLSPDEFNALVVRSEGLNSYGKTLQASSTPVASSSTSTSFAWDDFGIGMVSVIRAGINRRPHRSPAPEAAGRVFAGLDEGFCLLTRADHGRQLQAGGG